jgi:hypothetical protein
MNVQTQVDREPEAVRRITAVARQSSCPFFADLFWDVVDFDPFALSNNPGVMFESPRRIVVFQELGGELRYYAGAWCLDQDRRYLEEDRIEAEGREIGVFPTVRDALAFAGQYLIEERAFQTIHVPRYTRYSRLPDPNAADASARPDGGSS